MTDPIADILSCVHNASNTCHDSASIPSFKLRVNIAEILKSGGYIMSCVVEDAKIGKTLALNLKYGSSRERLITGVRRVSRPGLRVYTKPTDLPKTPSSLDVIIIFTSQGPLTDRQACKKKVGGGVPAYVW